MRNGFPKPVVAAAVILFVVSFALPASASNKLFVGGLPYHTDLSDVFMVVSQFGNVLSVEVQGTDSEIERSASAVVVFENPRSVYEAPRSLDDARCWDGSTLVATPIELLVIEEKILRIIHEAGLRSDGELVQAVSDKVHALIGAAVDRALANGRLTVHPLDLDCLHVDAPKESGEEINRGVSRMSGKKKPKEIVVVGSKVKEVIREAGLQSDGELVQTVSDKVHEILAAAIKRCTSNGRSTVRPYDL